MNNGTVDIEVQIHQPQHDCPLSPLDNKFTLHFDTDILGSGMLQIDDLRVEDHTQPVHTEHTEEVHALEFMPPLSLGMTDGIIIEIENRFGREGVGIFACMVSVGVMSPVLGEPGPFASSDEVGSETKEVIDPRVFGGGSVVGIVLHTNHCKSCRINT